MADKAIVDPGSTWRVIFQNQRPKFRNWSEDIVGAIKRGVVSIHVGIEDRLVA
jgi:hypothetical protein